MMLIENFLASFCIIILSSLYIFQCTQFNTLEGRSGYNYKIDSNFTLPVGPIYAKSWFKYINFKKDKKDKPKDFLKNEAFYQQMKNAGTVDLTENDSTGFINIPSE